MSRRRTIAALGSLAALTVALLSAPGATLASVALTAPRSTRATAPAAPAAAAATGTPAGHDYATDHFADPWDYSNLDDLLLDAGPTQGAGPIGMSGGMLSAHFSTNGYISPLWGGYGGPLLLGRDGAAAGNQLDASTYQTVSFQAWSSRDVPAGLMWFNCPGGAVAASCGGGVSFVLRAGWNTYVLSPHASVFAGWPLTYGGSINGLRLALSPGSPGSDFKLDWFRVVQPGSGTVVHFANPTSATASLVWDGNASDADNTTASSAYGVLSQIPAGGSGGFDVSQLPPGTYRIGTKSSAGFSSWTTITTTTPLPQVLTPNGVGDRDFAATVQHNPWDMQSAADVAAIGNATNVSFAGQLAATNTSNDPYASLAVGPGGINTAIYHNLTVTSAYDGPFNLQDIAGGGTMARVVWRRADGGFGQTDDILTYAGTRTVTINMGIPTASLVEPGTNSAAFVSPSPVTMMRWDPNEDRGARRWYLKNVTLRSDFTTTGTFPIAWDDAAYTPGSSATLIADTDRSGCNGTTIATGVAVQPGTNTTVWNTAGVPPGRYWLCLRITSGSSTTSAYASGVLGVGANPPYVDPSPTSSWDRGTLAINPTGVSYTVGGWAFDPDSPQQSINVDVYDQRPDGSSVGARLSTGVARPDVARGFPGTGQNAGFTGTIALVGAGRHTVCAYAINVGGGGNRLIGCRPVDVPGPLGSLDSLAWTASGGLVASGWAVDPAAPAAKESVDVYVTGPSGTVGTSLSTGSARPDVTRALPWAGPSAGFSGRVRTAGAGASQVCAYAIGVPMPWTHGLIACRSIVVG